MAKPGRTTERGYGWSYQLARARLLAGHPPCHWCALKGIVTAATTADHEPPISVVGHPHLSLVPACGPCNYGRRAAARVAPLGPSRDW